MKKCIKSILIITLSSLLCACNNGGNTPSPSNNKDDTPYTKVTLTEEGARRINAASERQNRVRNELRKYSNWLMPKYLSLESKAAVNPGDEVDEDMNFEIYPSDFDNLNKMFLIGRTKPSSSEAKGSTNLINITTNIPDEEISDYSLNGQISYLDGAGDINHDRIEYDSIPYQKETELTMTYTYIKKGTAADTSPYSCQPSFHITKVDNDAPEIIDNNLVFEASYTKSITDLKTYLIKEIGKKFEIKDEKLTKTVSISLTDETFETLKTESITAAKADTENHAFTSIDIPFIVSTENASTEVLHAQLNLVDDVLPEVWKNNETVTEVILNGGKYNKLPHKDTIKAGINSLMSTNGYEVIDEINGLSEIDFEVVMPELTDQDLQENKDKAATLKFSFSKNYENIEYIDSTTQFRFRPRSMVSEYSNDPKPLTTHCVKFNSVSTGYYIFDYNNTEGVFLDYSCFSLNTTNGLLVYEDLLLNEESSAFHERMPLDHVVRNQVLLWSGSHLSIIINSSTIFKQWSKLNLNGFRDVEIDAIYININNFEDKSEADTIFENTPPIISADKIYLSSESYDTDNWCYSVGSEYTTCFGFRILNNTLNNIHYGYSVDQFKQACNINY